MTKYPLIFDPAVPQRLEARAEVVLICECGFTVTDRKSKIARARKIMAEHKRARHPAARADP